MPSTRPALLSIDGLCAKVPIGLGCDGCSDRPLAQAAALGLPAGAGTQLKESMTKGTQLMDDSQVVVQDGVQGFIDLVMSEATPERPMTLVAIAPLDNVAEALRREPAIAERLNLVGMHGSVFRGYGGSKSTSAQPVPEYNVLRNVPAAQATFDAPWRSKLITPLDTCGLVTFGRSKPSEKRRRASLAALDLAAGTALPRAPSVSTEQYARLLASDSPLVQTILTHYRAWYANLPISMSKMIHSAYDPDVGSTMLFDTVAVLLALPPQEHTVYLEPLKSMQITFDDEGFTRPHPQSPEMGEAGPPPHTNTISVALKWKDQGLDAFRKMMTDRLVHPVPAVKSAKL